MCQSHVLCNTIYQKLVSFVRNPTRVVATLRLLSTTGGAAQVRHMVLRQAIAYIQIGEGARNGDAHDLMIRIFEST